MLDFSQEIARELKPRFLLVTAGIGILVLFVLFRLVMLQVVRGDFFWILSSEHTVKEMRTPATRGIFFDRNGIPLAENRPSFNLAVVPQYVRNRAAVEESLRKLAAVDPKVFERQWKWVKKLPPFFPVTLQADVPYPVAARVRTAEVTALGPPDPYDLRGVVVVPRPLRSYSLKNLFAATLGYLGEVSEKELARLQSEAPGRYFLGDLVGAAGLEKYWEAVLKGSDGFEQKIVDAVGREVIGEEVSELLTRRPPEHGSNLMLTLDARLQQFAEGQFRGKAGGLVALDPANGEILAWVSLPSYDPSRLSVNVPPEYWQSLVQNPRKLFLNRALQGYPPGSTFKVMTAIAGLEEGAIRPDEKVFCPGGVQYGKRFFRCWRSEGHGWVDLHRALAESCDTYFYKLGMKLGVDRIALYASRFGLGQPTGVDLGEEKGGLIPTSEWKRRVFGEEWFPGENLSVAVGQGSVLVTPLQNAAMIAAVANGGKTIPPHLLKEILPPGESEGVEVPPEEDLQPLEISGETLRRVRDALRDAVESPAGTAHGSRSATISIGGKTGTAQVISEEGRVRAGGGEHLKDHGWFVAFAPVDDPKIAMAVLVEHGGFGASSAAPIAKAVIEKYMELTSPQPPP